ncbi:MAG: amino acid permease [Desulfarculaceae bacterium]|nr:amino acid permease [Desulfarculaceae bacterium]MCF8049111.1 amino acid permease [Desulfarculaceae bacterium]MCF8063940.1 amino acid permease [Desulfarculaceae bacterium]MCF8099449.1 amino acid permease [Desulfarculaceae bacterium]MCF8122896.1 amino acid permease [Desulfarculaceae bacterium]
MADNPGGGPKRTLGIFTLAMINMAAILTLRNLPLMAFYGLASVFFYGVAALAFFLPVALVAAELATTYPEAGGVYAWVKRGFGAKYGFLAVWMDWVENVVWFPTVLSFVAATIAYAVAPSLDENKFFMVTVMLVVYWGATFINFFGMKASGLISSIGTIAGTIIPGSLLIIMAVIWLVMGKGVQFTVSWDAFIPEMKFSNMSFFAGVILGYFGIEMAAYHAREARDPKRDYPKAILLSVVIIVAIFIMGSLAIAVVVPAKDISLVAGLMQAMEKFFDPFGLQWLVPVLAVLVAAGGIAQISTWLVGPSKGLLATARDGSLPPVLEKVNKAHMPVSILVAQGLVSTVFVLLFLLVPNANSFYWILSALTAQITLIMYILMFASAIKLRYSDRDAKRPYQVPGGMAGMWIIGGLGLGASFFAFFVGFVPPIDVKISGLIGFEAFLILGIVVLSLPPFILERIKKPSWVPEHPEDLED